MKKIQFILVVIISVAFLSCKEEYPIPKELIGQTGVNQCGETYFQVINNSEVPIFIEVSVKRGKQAPHAWDCFLASGEYVELSQKRAAFISPYVCSFLYWGFQSEDKVEVSSTAIGKVTWEVNSLMQIEKSEYISIEGDGFNKHIIKKENAPCWAKMKKIAQQQLEGIRIKLKKKKGIEVSIYEDSERCYEAKLHEYTVREEKCRNSNERDTEKNRGKSYFRNH